MWHGAGGQIDIAPTILSYLDIDVPEHFLGHPLRRNEVRNSLEVVRIWPDGSAVTDGLLYNSTQEACMDRLEQKQLPEAECARLKHDAADLRLLSDVSILSDRVSPILQEPLE